MYRTELITFCGSNTNVVFDVNGLDGKSCFNNYENGEYTQKKEIVTRHPNILKGVLTSKKGWGLWVDEWSSGIVDWSFTKEEILEEFKKRKIELPESMMLEFDKLIEKKKKRRYPTEEQIKEMNALVGRG